MRPRIINRRWVVALCLALVAMPGLTALPVAVDGDRLPSLAPMLTGVQPAIVNISTTSVIREQEHPLFRDPFFRRFFNIVPRQRPTNTSLGSGVIVDADRGYVVTNHHVIDQADEITVTTKDGRELMATLVGSDPASDVAVIQVPTDNLTEITIGASADLQVGDFVVAIGSAFGLSQTVTSGIVSALGRSGLGIEGYEDFIQTDASINPGNSGGALVNLRGELVGINTAIFSRGGGSVGVGFSIPVDMVMSLMNQLLEYGEVKRGLLGVRMQDLTPSLAEAFGIAGQKGAVVSEVIPDSAAEDKGIREGDVIVEFNGRAVDNGADLRNAVGLVRPGTEAEMKFYRAGELMTVGVSIKDSAPGIVAGNASLGPLSGAQFTSLTTDSRSNRGVVVANIRPGSPAAHSGLEEGDIIVAINRQEVQNPQHLQAIVKAAAGGALLIKLVRNNRARFLVIQ